MNRISVRDRSCTDERRIGNLTTGHFPSMFQFKPPIVQERAQVEPGDLRLSCGAPPDPSAPGRCSAARRAREKNTQLGLQGRTSR
jgi:hypothetical protein